MVSDITTAPDCHRCGLRATASPASRSPATRVDSGSSSRASSHVDNGTDAAARRLTSCPASVAGPVTSDTIIANRESREAT